MSHDKGDMTRRNVLKASGAAASALAIGGAGVALTGNAAATSTATLDGPNSAVTAESDDGQILYVAYGGLLRFDWEGLDTEATYGKYKTETRVKDADGNVVSGWKVHGTGSGQLGDDGSVSGHDGDGVFEEGEGNSSNSWGGDNDSNSGSGTTGFWQFKFGSPWGQRDYAIAYDAESDVDSNAIAVNKPHAASLFEDDTEGDGPVATEVEIRKTCQVWNGDPTGTGTMLIEDIGTATMPVEVTNQASSGTTSGSLEGTVATDGS